MDIDKPDNFSMKSLILQTQNNCSKSTKDQNNIFNGQSKVIYKREFSFVFTNMFLGFLLSNFGHDTCCATYMCI